MNKVSRRSMLGISAASVAGCATTSSETTKLATASGDVGRLNADVTVNVQPLGGGSISGEATVTIEPRQSGLQDVGPFQTINGTVTFNVPSSGRYDIEVSHPDYYGESILNKLISTTGSPYTFNFYLEEL